MEHKTVTDSNEELTLDVASLKFVTGKNLNDAAEQIVKELANRNIRVSDLDEVFNIVREKVNNLVIVAR